MRKTQSDRPIAFYCGSGNIEGVPTAADKARRAAQRAELLKEIGERVKIARERKKMTRAALARYCGVDPGSITRVEQGAQAFDLPPLIAAAEALGVTIDSLLREGQALPAVAPAAPQDQDQRRSRR